MTLKDKHYSKNFFLQVLIIILLRHASMLSRGNFLSIIHKYFFNEINSNKLYKQADWLILLFFVSIQFKVVDM